MPQTYRVLCGGVTHNDKSHCLAIVHMLAVHGKFSVVGVPEDPVQLNAFPLVFEGRLIHGSLTGTPIDSEDTLAFSVVENIRPMIETFPLEKPLMLMLG
jgi:alcohol dehydrogenase, propanol-preferring